MPPLETLNLCKLTFGIVEIEGHFLVLHRRQARERSIQLQSKGMDLGCLDSKWLQYILIKNDFDPTALDFVRKYTCFLLRRVDTDPKYAKL